MGFLSYGYNDGPSATEIADAIWSASNRTLSEFGFTVETVPNDAESAIKAKTDLIPAAPATSQDIAAVGELVGQIEIPETDLSPLLDAISVLPATDLAPIIEAIRARIDGQSPGEGPVFVLPVAENPSQTMAYGFTRTAGGALEGGILITFQLNSVAGNGSIYDKEISVTSSIEPETLGRIAVPLVKGAAYRARRGEGSWKIFTTSQEGTFELPSFMGA